MIAYGLRVAAHVKDSAAGLIPGLLLRPISKMYVRSATIDEMPIVRKLFQEYRDEKQPSEEDTSFHNFDKELKDLPGLYSPPRGRILLALNDDQDVTGCVGLNPFANDICEMKRLYVRPKYRGLGLGRLLIKTILEEAKTAGYDRMHLDALDSWKEAIGLYEVFGFKEIPAYFFNPVSNERYFSKQL